MRTLLVYLLHLTQNIRISPAQRQRIFNTTALQSFERTQIHRIASRNRFVRMNAARYLSSIGTDDARKAIEKALLKEKHFPTKLYLANALSDIKDPRSLYVLVQSLYGSHYWYRHKVNMLIASYGDAVKEVIHGYFWRTEIEIRGTVRRPRRFDARRRTQKLSHRCAAARPGGSEKIEADLRSICRKNAAITACMDDRRRDHAHRQCPYKGKVANSFRCSRYHTLVTSISPASNYRRLMVSAAKMLGKYYPEVLFSDDYLEHVDKEIQSIAILSLGQTPRPENFRRLIEYLGRDETADAAREGLRNLLNHHPTFILKLVEAFQSSEAVLHNRLAEVLSHRIEYIITKLLGHERDVAAGIVGELISMGRVSEIIEFLKRNRNPSSRTGSSKSFGPVCRTASFWRGSVAFFSGFHTRKAGTGAPLSAGQKAGRETR